MNSNLFEFVIKKCPKCGKKTNAITNRGICPSCHDEENLTKTTVKK